MRKLIIRFSKEGELFREIDEDRHYFLCEAEETVQTIRKRLAQEKRAVEPKPFTLWLDGQETVIMEETFDNDQSLEKMLENAMLHTDSWPEEVRYKYVNHLKEWGEQERQLFLSKEFRAFAIRFDQVLGRPKTEPSPYVPGIQELKQLFDAVYAHVTTGFYSELEEIIDAVKTAWQTVASQEEGLDTIEDKEGFNQFIQYVAACYQSVPKKRIDALYARFQPYQELESFLFTEFAASKGFDAAYRLHVELHEALLKKYDDILFQGFLLKTDDMVESLVLMPVTKKHWDQVHQLFSEDGEGNAENANTEDSVS